MSYLRGWKYGKLMVWPSNNFQIAILNLIDFIASNFTCLVWTNSIKRAYQVKGVKGWKLGFGDTFHKDPRIDKVCLALFKL